MPDLEISPVIKWGDWLNGEISSTQKRAGKCEEEREEEAYTTSCTQPWIEMLSSPVQLALPQHLLSNMKTV